MYRLAHNNAVVLVVIRNHELVLYRFRVRISTLARIRTQFKFKYAADDDLDADVVLDEATVTLGILADVELALDPEDFSELAAPRAAAAALLCGLRFIAGTVIVLKVAARAAIARYSCL